MEPLRRLLEELEIIGKDHEELYDSEVRIRMGGAIFDGYLRQIPTCVLPDDFGMYSADSNRKVKAALNRFVEDANRRAGVSGKTDFRSRLTAYQEAGVRTSGEGISRRFLRMVEPGRLRRTW